MMLIMIIMLGNNDNYDYNIYMANNNNDVNNDNCGYKAVNNDVNYVDYNNDVIYNIYLDNNDDYYANYAKLCEIVKFLTASEMKLCLRLHKFSIIEL